MMFHLKHQKQMVPKSKNFNIFLIIMNKSILNSFLFLFFISNGFPDPDYLNLLKKQLKRKTKN